MKFYRMLCQIAIYFTQKDVYELYQENNPTYPHKKNNRIWYGCWEVFDHPRREYVRPIKHDLLFHIFNLE